MKVDILFEDEDIIVCVKPYGMPVQEDKMRRQAMHFVKAKGILSSKNGMNLYRGCSHGCIYCDSRSRCYHMEHAFEDIEVKENAINLLEYALKHKRKKCMIGTGSMADPYIPLELEGGLTVYKNTLCFLPAVSVPCRNK